VDLIMDASLQGLLDLPGVNAAMVFDGTGRLTGQRGRAVYDRALCEQVSAMLAKAVDSITLQQDDWEVVTAHFADGTILLRNIRAVGGATYVLAVVADATLNPAFASVAIRVAANKLKKGIEGVGASSPGASSSAALPVDGSGSQVPPAAASGTSSRPSLAASGTSSKPSLANSGLSWSRLGGSSVSAVMAADPASSAYLTRCAKEMARYVGPMAKVYVEDAVRHLCPDAPFGMGSGKALGQELAGQIEDAKDRAQFLKAIEAAST
jgi:predicted regulator of Ras-like GTPase activity (Roadblock/LC7/MglB family)